ncbi:polysaccharide pyruvyl transferase family protein [Tautonia plasticadhaerens]|uniref:Polysaccharide pyruvyl transferase n=1 Tax=Tautonia plasticadhaerens TaxID=2527974 RepID=A0A518GWH6_9BACT|nr:polysaccharide pyruvyl transferase family protein [Tautonia plasticadhaerens]QDV32938.1 Polysaccharide pyruvyl transferase [Tautonia plasticadhaerens]
MILSRRDALRSLLAPALLGVTPGPGRPEAPTVLLRSGWQTENIGDIAHTPGLLALLERHWPEADVILWPGRLDRDVEPMLRRRFPRLRLVREQLVGEPRVDDPTLDEAIARADLLIHGSGPSIVGAAAIRRWRDASEKPFGLFGVTISAIDDDARDLIAAASFVFTRETRSLDLVRDAGLDGTHVRFVPDATFALDLRDESAADRLLGEHGLEPGRFACVVPRLRYTPYWEIRPGSVSEDRIRERTAVNAQFAEQDHAKLREAVVAWVRGTGGKVLIAPEMTYQVDIIRPLVFDPLPDDVKPNVVPLDRFWLTDEAASVYRRAAAVVSMECHSPIIALAGGTPALYVRQPTDTWKGRMYPDLGLGDWLVEVDDATGADLSTRLLAFHEDPDAARGRRDLAIARASDLFRLGISSARGAIRAG